MTRSGWLFMAAAAIVLVINGLAIEVPRIRPINLAAVVTETPIRSPEICAELDLRIMNNATPVKPEVIDGMRHYFDRFVADAINRCTDGKQL